jgi:hypothetical protein
MIEWSKEGTVAMKTDIPLRRLTRLCAADLLALLGKEER